MSDESLEARVARLERLCPVSIERVKAEEEDPWLEYPEYGRDELKERCWLRTYCDGPPREGYNRWQKRLIAEKGFDPHEHRKQGLGYSPYSRDKEATR